MHISLLNPKGNFDSRDSHLSQHPDFGGQLVYVKELALRLGWLGHRVDIVTRRIDDPAWQAYGQELDAYPGAENVRIVRIPCGPEEFLRKTQLWPYLDEWAANIRDFYRRDGSRPDVYSAHSAKAGYVAARLQQSEGTRFTFTGHSLGAMQMEYVLRDGLAFDELIRWHRMDRRVAAERTALAHASVVITNSEIERREQLTHPLYQDVIDLGDENAITVIPPGVNTVIFHDDASRDEGEDIVHGIEQAIRRDIPLARRHLPMVVCSNRIVRMKNVIGLVRAWAHSETLMASANLIISIVGEENPFRAPSGTFTASEETLLNEIRQLIDERNLWPCVMTLSFPTQHDLAAGYRLLARRHRGVFALVSLYEPFGLAPLEAISCGLPAVVTKNGGPSENLGGGAGVLVDPEDPDDIAAGLLKLVNREESWHTYRDAGMARVRERFRWDQTSRKYEEVLRHVVDGHGSVNYDHAIPEWISSAKGSSEALQWLKQLWDSR